MNTFRFMVTLTLLGAWPSSGQICPSSNFEYCAFKTGSCTIPANTEGYISYGLNGKYVLTPFKTFGQGMTLNCGGELGDILYGTDKYCCYQRVKLDIPTVTGYSRLGSESVFLFHYLFNFPVHSVTHGTIRYGRENMGFLYSTAEPTALFQCSNRQFGHILPGTQKVCDVSSAVPPSLQAETGGNLWRVCGAADPGKCTGLEKGKTHWVRYGANGKFSTSRLITTTTGEFDCNLPVFQIDPAYGTRKACEVSASVPSFSAVTGKWVRIQSCNGNGCVSEMSVTEGITKTESHSITNAFTTSLELSMKSGINFEIDGVGLSHETTLTLGMSHTLTNAVSNSLTVSRSVTKKFSCSAGALYQWVYGATRLDVVSSTSFDIRTADYACVDDRYTPQCPATFCERDTNCQICTQPLPAFVAVVHPIEDGSEGEGVRNTGAHVVGYASLLVLCAACMMCLVGACAYRGFLRRKYTTIGDGEWSVHVQTQEGTRLAA